MLILGIDYRIMNNEKNSIANNNDLNFIYLWM